MRFAAYGSKSRFCVVRREWSVVSGGETRVGTVLCWGISAAGRPRALLRDLILGSPQTGTEIASVRRGAGLAVVSRVRNGWILATKSEPRLGTMRLSRIRDNARISAIPVDLMRLGASLMKMRLSVLCGVLLALGLVALSALPALAANNQQLHSPFEGDPTGGFYGNEGNLGGSGGAASSGFVGGDSDHRSTFGTSDQYMRFSAVVGIPGASCVVLPPWFLPADFHIWKDNSAAIGYRE